LRNEKKKQAMTPATSGYQHALRPRRPDFLRCLRHQRRPLAGGNNMNVHSDIDMPVSPTHHDRKNGRLLAGDML